MKTELEDSQNFYNEIKKHLLFFISEERISCSTLLDLIKLSPGYWFDVEELAFRKSIKKICKDLKLIHEIIKKIDEIEYNELTGQIRITNSKVLIDDIINEKTIIFYSQIEFDENKLTEIITENKLNLKIVRFLNYNQLSRRDLKPLIPILKNKVDSKNSDIVILKMSSRIEAKKIYIIINQLYPNIGSCFAITNYFPLGSLSINLPDNNSMAPERILVENSKSDATVIVSKYVYRANEYPVILDHLIENNLKPLIYRNFVEYRSNNIDLQWLQKSSISIPYSNIGVFSLITFDSVCKAKRASKLIKELIDYLCVKTIENENLDLSDHSINPSINEVELDYKNEINLQRFEELKSDISSINDPIKIKNQSLNLRNNRNKVSRQNIQRNPEYNKKTEPRRNNENNCS